MMNQRKRWWFIFYQNKIVIEQTNEGLYTIPHLLDMPLPKPPVEHIHEFTFQEYEPCIAFELSELPPLMSSYSLVGLRDSYDYLAQTQYLAAGYASQLIYWDKTSCFCPVCGTEPKRKALNMKKCPHCQKELYPPVQTAIIVLIQKGEEILLAHAHNFKAEFYSLIAGFVEIGETLEEAVQREVKEETGLAIQNIRYFGSQPWPYPSGLMVGFVADYRSGEIKLQEEELRSAAFYSKENLPTLPQKLSIARRLIDWWLTKKQ